MTANEKKIKKYILSRTLFTWYSDIAENTIWGFRNAPYKSFTRAMTTVKKVVASLQEEGLVTIEAAYQKNGQPCIYPVKQ